MAKRFIHFTLTQSFLAHTKVLAQKLPVYSGSHRGEIANFVGTAGELLVAHWLRQRGLAPSPVGLIDHDMELQLESGGSLHFDIKTKDRTVAPRPGYEATVPAYVYDKQSPHFYVFVSLLRPKSATAYESTDAYIVGAISRGDFDRKKYFVESGPKPNGAIFFCDAWNVEISQLDEPASFPPKLHGTV